MAARTRTATTARKASVPAAPARRAATVKAAPAANGKVDLAALAGSVKKVAAMPKAARNGGGSKNPFIEQVGRSHAEGAPLATGTLPGEAVVKTVITAIRRAAAHLNLGVSIRTEEVKGGFVVTFQAKPKRIR